jgi:hypothetical protein
MFWFIVGGSTLLLGAVILLDIIPISNARARMRPMWDSMSLDEMWPALTNNRQVLAAVAPRCVFPGRLGEVFHMELGLPFKLSVMNEADAFCATLPIEDQAKYADIVARVFAHTDDQVMGYLQDDHPLNSGSIGALAHIALHSTNANARFLAGKKLDVLCQVMRQLGASPGVSISASL